MEGAYLNTATAGPRTVPVRSSLAGAKTLKFSRPPRPSDVLRAGTARAPVVVSRCARERLYVRDESLTFSSNAPHFPARFDLERWPAPRFQPRAHSQSCAYLYSWVSRPK